MKAAFAGAQNGLTLIEQRILSTLEAEAPALSEISKYLLNIGGKRIRPLIAVLSERLFGAADTSQEVIDVASGIELIHMATLLHDDIIDESLTRRNKPSAYSKFGLSSTLLTGDFLFVRAFGLCANLDNFVVRATEDACVNLIEGEELEGRICLRKDYNIEHYINVIGKKTASLFSLAAKVGAYLAGGTQQEVETMSTFGNYSGICFQIIDDILDITAEESLLGKPTGTDLKQKTPSIVNILWYNSGDKKAVEFFTEENKTEHALNDTIAYLKNSAVIEESRFLAMRYASLAKAELNKITSPRIDLQTKDHLEAIIDYTLERCM